MILPETTGVEMLIKRAKGPDIFLFHPCSEAPNNIRTGDGKLTAYGPIMRAAVSPLGECKRQKTPFIYTRHF